VKKCEGSSRDLVWSNCLGGPRKTRKNAPRNRSTGHVVFRTFAPSWQGPVSFLLSARPSVRMHQLGCHGTDFQEILETFTKIRRENPNFRKIVQRYRILCMKMSVGLLLPRT